MFGDWIEERGKQRERNVRGAAQKERRLTGKKLKYLRERGSSQALGSTLT